MEQDIQKSFLSLIKKRKNQLNMIEQNMNNNDANFIKCFRLNENIEQVLYKDRESSKITIRNLLLFCSFLSNTIYLENTPDKLKLIMRICEQYELFDSQKVPYNAKFQISQLARLAINPCRADLGINISENTSSQELLKDFSKMAKVITLPEEMSYTTVLESICNVLNLTFNMFSDNIYINKECFEIVQKIDSIISNKFLQPIFDVCFSASEQLIQEDFQKLTEIIFDEDKHLQYTSISQMINEFEANPN